MNVALAVATGASFGGFPALAAAALGFASYGVSLVLVVMLHEPMMHSHEHFPDSHHRYDHGH